MRYPNKIRTDNATELARILAIRAENQPRANDILTLQKCARILHRIAEDSCNYDTGCPKCSGEGCKACGMTGDTNGPREARNERRVMEIAARYNMRAYFQTDPRGWPIYLIPVEDIPAAERLGQYVYTSDGPKILDPTDRKTREKLQARWIGSNYNRGFAVCPH